MYYARLYIKIASPATSCTRILNKKHLSETPCIWDLVSYLIQDIFYCNYWYYFCFSYPQDTLLSHILTFCKTCKALLFTRTKRPAEALAAAAMAVTYDKAARVLFWGGVSSALASLLALLGLASWWPAFLASWTLAGATYLTLASFKVRLL